MVDVTRFIMENTVVLYCFAYFQIVYNYKNCKSKCHTEDQVNDLNGLYYIWDQRAGYNYYKPNEVNLTVPTEQQFLLLSA